MNAQLRDDARVPDDYAGASAPAYRAGWNDAIAALAAPAGDYLLREIDRALNGDVLAVLMDVQNGIDSPGLVGMANSAIRRLEYVKELATRLVAPSKEAGDSGLQFTDATIDKLQDVMATHGFVVPVRVISDAFRTTQYALANPPGDQRQEGDFTPTGRPQECDTMEAAVMLAERALWQDDEGVRWVPEAAFQRAITEVESLESKLYPIGCGQHAGCAVAGVCYSAAQGGPECKPSGQIASPPPEAAAAVIEGSRDFVSATEASRIARVVQQLRNDSEDDAADLIELLSSQRREHRAKHKSYKRRFREAQAKLAALASPTEAMVDAAIANWFRDTAHWDAGEWAEQRPAFRAVLTAALAARDGGAA